MDDSRKFWKGNAVKKSYNIPETNPVSAQHPEMTIMDQLQERIYSAARQIREIGLKLEHHADAMHGCSPTASVTENEEPDRPFAALDRIWQALGDLDAAVSFNALQAGRNSTLA